MAIDTRSTQFFGIQITLSTSTATNLLTALRLIDANIPGSVRELLIQGDVAQAGTLLIGDAAISTSRYGASQVVAGTTPPVPLAFGTGNNVQDVPLGAVYLFSAAAMKVNILAFA